MRLDRLSCVHCLRLVAWLHRVSPFEPVAQRKQMATSMTMTVAWALLIVRVVVGLTLAAHGAQKSLGWFGGAGYAKARQGFQAQGFRPASLWLGLAVLGELGGGLSLAFGFLTPLGAAGAVGAMAVAINSHWAKGFFGA